jgi:hypothetical protein
VELFERVGFCAGLPAWRQLGKADQQLTNWWKEIVRGDIFDAAALALAPRTENGMGVARLHVAQQRARLVGNRRV